MLVFLEMGSVKKVQKQIGGKSTIIMLLQQQKKRKNKIIVFKLLILLIFVDWKIIISLLRKNEDYDNKTRKEKRTIIKNDTYRFSN